MSDVRLSDLRPLSSGSRLRLPGRKGHHRQLLIGFHIARRSRAPCVFSTARHSPPDFAPLSTGTNCRCGCSGLSSKARLIENSCDANWVGTHGSPRRSLAKPGLMRPLRLLAEATAQRTDIPAGCLYLNRVVADPRFVPDKTRPPQNRRSGFSAESRTLQFAGEMRRSADHRYDEREFFCHFLNVQKIGKKIDILWGKGDIRAHTITIN